MIYKIPHSLKQKNLKIYNFGLFFKIHPALCMGMQLHLY